MRFKFIQDNELQELSKGFVPENTAMSTKWARKNFQAWKEARNSRRTRLIQIGVSRFVVETRNTAGEPYPPAAIYQKDLSD